MSESLREQIAKAIFSHDGEIDDWVETTQEIRDVYLGIADSILPLIRKAVEEIGKPVFYPDFGGESRARGYDLAIEAVLKLLEVEYE
uniref:Uncharacterized protein n=1 Tax=viral metagenome TaxID=1070528 RepID=A0A6M3KB77_9ZZZZ